VLEGVAGDYWTVREGKGFDDIIGQYPGIKVVARQPANWERARGMEVMENILQAHRDIDLVFGMNDNMALGALQAIENAGLLGKIKVIGYNAQQDALQAIKEGRLNATVAKQPGNIGRMIIEGVIVKVMEGKKGEVQPVIHVAPVLVTKENLSKYLKK
jgi:ABC-type sugar transport system substrate-binding protein